MEKARGAEGGFLFKNNTNSLAVCTKYKLFVPCIVTYAVKSKRFYLAEKLIFFNYIII
jgi:hypothetical protein